MLLKTYHCTTYEYAGATLESHNEVRLKPIDSEAQKCISFDLKIQPAAKTFSFFTPGGWVHHFGIRTPHSRLVIEATSTVETKLENPFQNLNLLHEDFDFYTQEQNRQRYAEYLAESPFVQFLPGVQTLIDRANENADRTTSRFIMDLKSLIYDEFRYDPDVTNVHTRLDDVLELSAGVCQDFAHLMIAGCRMAGLPARYCSGYLFIGDAPDLRGDQATHAWVEVLMPNHQWLGIDPTNSILTNDRHITVHTGRDYSEVTPTRGVYTGFRTTSLDVEVRITNVMQEVKV